MFTTYNNVVLGEERIPNHFLIALFFLGPWLGKKSILILEIKEGLGVNLLRDTFKKLRLTAR